MNFRRTALLTALAIGLVTLPPPLTATRASAQASHDRFTEDFTIPSPCVNGLVVSGTANFFVVTTTRVDKNGVAHININAFADGTATDNNGGSYRFNYFNHSTADVPPGGFPQQVRVTDHFNLNGKGKAAHMHVGFVITVTVTGPGPDDFTINVINLRGDAFVCDPI
jgi:hypothetical protein